MKKRAVIVAIALLGIGIILSFYFDSAIVRIISESRNVFLNSFFLGIEKASSKIIIFVFLTALFLFVRKKRKWVLPLWATLGLATVLSFILKFSIQRLRPFQKGFVKLYPVLEKASHLTWNFSFPSFHAVLVFCAVPLLSKEYPKFKYVWIIFAVLVSFSRVYFGLHFLSDVLVGGILGYMIGLIILEIEKGNKFWEKIYKKSFKK